MVLNRTFIEEVLQEAAGTLIPEAVGGSSLLAPSLLTARLPGPRWPSRCAPMGALLRKAVGTLPRPGWGVQGGLMRTLSSGPPGL